jgi:thiol-disulfide isomerase/thioredoxin
MLLVILSGILLSRLPVYSQGVNFRDVTLAQALESARAESRLVMVDCQTTWCGPCKYMSNTVFPLKEAGDFFNKHFVCVEFDMEKGEGLEIAKRYNVRSYPTFLFLDANGNLQHRVVGASDLQSFIARVEPGLDPKNSLFLLEKEFRSGKMKKERKLAYLLALEGAGDREIAPRIKEELLGSLTTTEKLSATYWPLIKKNTLEMMDFVEQHREQLEKSIGKQAVNDFMNETCVSLLNNYITLGAKSDSGDRLLASIHARVDRQAIIPGVAMEVKLKIADAISSGAGFSRVIDLVAENANALSMDELLGFTVIFGKIDKEEKAMMAKIATIGDVMISKVPEERIADIKPALEIYFAQFKKAAATGVYWEELSLAAALDKAKREKKFLFVDCHATWCGPCIYMANTVFTRPEVGDFFNDHFISVKYDMEQGEGPGIMTRYGVKVLPTFLVLNPDGSVQHKIIGASDNIVEEARKGLDDATASSALDKKYAAIASDKENAPGAGDKEFLLEYLARLIDFHDADKAREVYDALDPLLTDDERTSAALWFLYEDDEFCGRDSDAFNYLLEHRKAFNASVGKRAVDEKIALVYKRRLLPVLLGKEKPAPGEILAMKKEIAPYKLAGRKELFACIDIANAVAAGDPDKLLKVAAKALKNLTRESIDVAIFTLDYLKQHTTGKIETLKKMADELQNRLAVEEYKNILTGMFEEKEGGE